MPIQHKRRSVTGILPVTSPQYDPNWNKLQRQNLLDKPSVTTSSTTIALAAGAPGAFSTFVFVPTASPIFDRYNIVGPANASSLRVPWDGLYDVFYTIRAVTLTQIFEILTVLQSAPTSDSGFGAPVFASVANPPSGFACEGYLQNNLAAPKVPCQSFVGHCGLEFHANDLLQIVGQASAVAAESVTIQDLSVRWAAPIPNNMQQV